jgi:hypothetical protein
MDSIRAFGGRWWIGSRELLQCKLVQLRRGSGNGRHAVGAAPWAYMREEEMGGGGRWKLGIGDLVSAVALGAKFYPDRWCLTALRSE